MATQAETNAYNKGFFDALSGVIALLDDQENTRSEIRDAVADVRKEMIKRGEVSENAVRRTEGIVEATVVMQAMGLPHEDIEKTLYAIFGGK